MSKYHTAASGKSQGKLVPCLAQHQCRNGGSHYPKEVLDKVSQETFTPVKDLTENDLKAYATTIILSQHSQEQQTVSTPTITHEDGTKEWRNPQGLLHREDGPAIEEADGYKAWYQNGVRHREDGPAIEYADGSKYWYQSGKLHREGGPAIEEADGPKEWYQNGELHREDGPAVEYPDGYKAWWKNGKLHREAPRSRNSK